MTTQENLIQQADVLTNKAADLANEIMLFSSKVAAFSANGAGHGSPFITSLTVFMLACFVGYYVVWRVTPALHSPLMGVTNAISSVIIVGALIAAGGGEGSAFAKAMGFFAVLLASINIFGGFIVTQRMLQMFKKKTK